MDSTDHLSHHTAEQAETSSNGSGAHASPASQRQQRRRGFSILLLGASLVLGITGGVGGYVIADRFAADGSMNGSSSASGPIDAPAPKTSASTGSSLSDGTSKTPAEIYEQVAPAVVHIQANVRVQSQSFFGPQEQEGEATGSGFVIDQQGHIVTNAHVVDGAESVVVGFEGEDKFAARIIGVDTSTDIAVLKVDPSDKKLKNALSPVSFGDSTAVKVGDPVVAIGNPFNLDRTLTTGVVSALQRELRAPNGFAIEDVVQTDAAVNPGNSGGPLLNMRGELIGVNSQIQTGGGNGNDGIAFAVPSSTVKRVVKELIDTGKVDHAWLGVSGTDVDSTIAELLNLPVKQGVLVGTVPQDSPAGRAGIEGGDRKVIIDGQSYVLGGDIIVSIGGEKVTSMRELADEVVSFKPGDKVRVEWYRGGKKRSEKIKLGTRPEASDTKIDR